MGPYFVPKESCTDLPLSDIAGLDVGSRFAPPKNVNKSFMCDL